MRRQWEGSSGQPSKKKRHPAAPIPGHPLAQTAPQQPDPHPAPNPLLVPPSPAAPRPPPRLTASPQGRGGHHQQQQGGYQQPCGDALPPGPAPCEMSAHGHHPASPLPPPGAPPTHPPHGGGRSRALTWAGCHGHRPQLHVLLGALGLGGRCGAGGGGERRSRGKPQVGIDHALGRAPGCPDCPHDSCSTTVAPTFGAAKEKCGRILQEKFAVRCRRWDRKAQLWGPAPCHWSQRCHPVLFHAPKPLRVPWDHGRALQLGIGALGHGRAAGLSVPRTDPNPWDRGEKG